MAEKGAKYVQNVMEKRLLGLDTSRELPPRATRPTSVRETLEAAIDFFSSAFSEEGHVASDYGGPLFLMPGLVFTAYISGTIDEVLPAPLRAEAIRYLSNLQRADSGGWGIHIESPATMFGTALNYCVMRLLGVQADDVRCVRARVFMRENGGAVSIPSWGKWWLATLGVYDWEGLYPLPPEMWLLPESLIFHPSRWWCHARVVYEPQALLYALRATGPITPLIAELRIELYATPYHSIDWLAARDLVCPLDIVTEHSWLHKLIFAVCSLYERNHIPALRRRAIEVCMDHIRVEALSSSHICIGPVNAAANTLVAFHMEGRKSPNFRAHVARLADYLWVAADGAKMQGYNGSQLWDTAFSVQAIIATGMVDRAQAVLQRAYHYIDITQVREDVPNKEKYYRHQSKGAWPFSTRDHGWPISDCTAEGVKSVLLLQQLPFIDRNAISPRRLKDAVNVILSLQNLHAHGGWATYELQRAPEWLELINPSEVFDQILIDYEWVEPTSACVQALVAFRQRFPTYRRKAVAHAIARGVDFIKYIQRPDGSFIGGWAICFTYGTWFAVEGLIAADEKPSSKAVQAACKFLLSKQNADGGWGESYLSCVKKQYINCESQVVNTSWALMSLMRADWPDRRAIDAGIKLLMDRQLANGDWAQERISGIFNSCCISYSAYKNCMTIWALGMYHRKYEMPSRSKL